MEVLSEWITQGWEAAVWNVPEDVLHRYLCWVETMNCEMICRLNTDNNNMYNYHIIKCMQLNTLSLNDQCSMTDLLIDSFVLYMLFSYRRLRRNMEIWQQHDKHNLQVTTTGKPWNHEILISQRETYLYCCSQCDSCLPLGFTASQTLSCITSSEEQAGAVFEWIEYKKVWNWNRHKIQQALINKPI